MTVAKLEREPPAMESKVKRQHVLDLDDYTIEELEQVLNTADAMAEVLQRPIRRVPTLRGKTIVTAFFEPSTRTRSSFELAGKVLSADVINLSPSDSSGKKGESLVDTARTLQAMGADVMIMRHPCSGAPNLVARHTNFHVINAGDGWHAHPSQGLLDLYTARQQFGRIRGLRVAIVGDIAHSRVARSDIYGLTKMGAEVVLCGPATLLPMALVEAFGECGALVRVENSVDAAVEGADVVIALRLQKERQTAGLLPSLGEYARLYQINEARMAHAKSTALVMHPGPMNEGIEISPGVAHGAQSLVERQVTNGVAVRMALLYLLCAGGEAP